MFPRILLFLSLILQLKSAKSIQLYHVLDQQCWHEYPLSTIHYYSLPDGVREYVSIIQSVISDTPFNSIAEEDYAPWSYPLECTEVLPSINDQLCIYTSTTFSNGRGISVFTTPTLAEKILSLPAFNDPEALRAQDINVFPGTWETAPIPGKGIGIVASKALEFKDRVTAHTPAFLAYVETELSMLEREAWWRFAIEQLPGEIRDAFMDLAYIFGDERIRVQDIVKANTFQIDIDGANHFAVFPETSRLNHACNPNAQYIIDSDFLTHLVQVTRPIAKGEEITISYTSPLEQHSIRQEQLQHGFHFTCTCPRCSSAPSSDHSLETIKSLQAQLNDWSPSSSGSPEMAEQLMQLHRDEGLEGFMDVAYGFAALAYNAAGDGERATHFAERAKEAILMKDGRWAPNLQLWNDVLADPRKHWSYRRRM